jgi:DUF4097 and DUF4098 domain-containing protein YvlB
MQKSFDIDGPAQIEVRLASGDVQIDPTLDGRVEVELVAHDEESQHLVDDARIELRDRHLLVDVPQKRSGFNFAFMFGRSGITCHIRCPRDSAVSAKTKSADVRCSGTIGGLNVSTASGDVDADRVSGGVNVKSASGDVSVREIGAGVNVQTASGDVELGVVRGAANVGTASGDVSIEEAYDDVNANTVSGDQEHGAVMRGNVSAHSVSGDVTIGVRRGSRVWLDCNTVSGDTSSELDLTTDVPEGDGPMLEVRAKTVSGDINIRRAPAPEAPPAHTNGAQEVHA